MPDQRIGQILRRIVPLSGHDIEEILHEQAGSQKRFGEIALTMGLCSREHILRAWIEQLGEAPHPVNLRDLGIDAQAVQRLDAATSLRHRAIPVRLLGDQLVVAVEPENLEPARAALDAALAQKPLFVLADKEQIDTALAKYHTRAA